MPVAVPVAVPIPGTRCTSPPRGTCRAAGTTCAEDVNTHFTKEGKQYIAEYLGENHGCRSPQGIQRHH